VFFGGRPRGRLPVAVGGDNCAPRSMQAALCRRTLAHKTRREPPSRYDSYVPFEMSLQTALADLPVNRMTCWTEPSGIPSSAGKESSGAG